MDDLKLYDWGEIKDKYQYESLILGNGASIAINKCFSYKSLFEQATFTGNAKKVFEEINTVDFELVLNKLRQTSAINEILGINDENKTEEAYQEIRNNLIKTVKESHISYSEANNNLLCIRMFMGSFKNVISLNYDLIVYWAMMVKNVFFPDNLEFKDCFPSGKFDDNWGRFYTALRPGNQVTLVFYPHGNLILATDNDANEYKINTNPASENLLDEILKNWNDKNGVPMFVSEGDSKQKKKAIKRSFYLSVVYDEVLRNLGKNIIIYGWSMADQDNHIVERVLKGNKEIKTIAISMMPNDNVESLNEAQRKIIAKVRRFNKTVMILFFNATSKGCWIN